MNEVTKFPRPPKKTVVEISTTNDQVYEIRHMGDLARNIDDFQIDLMNDAEWLMRIDPTGTRVIMVRKSDIIGVAMFEIDAED